MNVLERLAHARTLERLERQRSPQPREPEREPSVGLRERLVFHERSSPPDSSAGAGLSQGPGLAQVGFECRRLELRPGQTRPRLLGGCLAQLPIPSATQLARDLACLGAARAGRPAVIDLESTGLAGAAVPFVVGVAWVGSEGIELRQWVLARVGAEAEMLADLIRCLAEQGAAPLISFNGASFDLPLLRLRAQRHGLDASVFDGAHVDLLHPARRVYRAELGDCRLATLERRVLGVHRRGDIEGAEIPQVFWDFVQSRSAAAAARLEAVCAHNLVDILSLPSLAVELASQLRSPTSLERARRAARHWLGLGAHGYARRLLATWVDPGHGRGRPRGAASASASSWRAAALELAVLERRAGNLDGAARLWQAAWHDDPGCPSASEAWAKHLEHTAGDFEAALAVARGSRLPCPQRIARLERRAAASGSTAQRVGAVEPAKIETPAKIEASEGRPPAPAPRAREHLAARIDDEHGATVRYRLLV